MTRLWTVAAAFALAGCNIAYSPTPLFAPNEADHSAHLKPGIWRNDEDCAAPQTTQHCADAESALITAATIEMFDDKAKQADKAPVPWSYLIVHGPPLLMQTRVQRADEDLKDANYVFVAVEPVAKDPYGAITRARIWVVQCGPPEGSSASKSPLPGMTMVGSDCIPRDHAVLFDAAVRSRAWASSLTTISWAGAKP